MFTLAAFADDMRDAIKTDLEVVVDGVSSNQGNVRIAVFSEADASLFPDRSPPLKQSAVATGGPATFYFRNLAAGRYAVLAFHDENGNDVLDRNLFGIPEEHWGVTGKRPFGRPPRYMESAFMLDSEHRKITIHLE